MRTSVQKPKAAQQTPAKSTLPVRSHFGQCREMNSFLHSQRTIGNQAVQRLPQSNAEERNAVLTGTASPNFGYDFSRISVTPPKTGAIQIQAKLAINKPGDEYEQEADRIAERVMGMPESKLRQRACACGGTCPKCKAKQLNQESERLQTKQVRPSDSAQVAAPPIVNEVLAGSGQPLDQLTRAFMEPRFGHDFSQVQVHTDNKAAKSAQAVNALAYTVGQHVVFGASQFVPTTGSGRRLLAHELAHVIQQSPRGPSASIAQNLKHAIHQSKGPTRTVTVQRAGDPAQAPSMNCELATSTPASVVEEILFAQNSAVVPATDVINLQRITTDWALNGFPDVRIDGYASVEGSQAHNWGLSCRRAEAIKSVLTSAPQGIPSDRIRIVAHGEGEEAGPQRPANRRATVVFRSPPPTPTPTPAPTPTPSGRICGPDITTSLASVLGRVDRWFAGLSTFRKRRSCLGLGPFGPFALVNPLMAWDTRELFLPNTGWLDRYLSNHRCGSPQDPRCFTDPHRRLCETAATCGNSVVVGGKCMLAGTANYALFGKMCRLCHDHTGQWNRSSMRAIIHAWKWVGDDPTPPKEVASAAFDGSFPTVPAAAENRGSCTGRCRQTHSGAFDFIWEPYKPR